MRKLASIQTIDVIRPIPGADSIECAVIGGWNVVVRKGEFCPGTKCVFFEIDSVLPIKPEFEFLRKTSYIRTTEYEGFRLRTITLRKQISQGLIIPVPMEYMDREVGEDLTDQLGVLKYEKPIPTQISGVASGTFPFFIPKTDQERIQNLYHELRAWSAPGCLEENSQWEVTEKLEGSSMTVYLDGDHFGVCSRGWELFEAEGNSLWKMARSLDIENRLRRAGIDRVALQGELIGPGIQGNHYNLATIQFRVFDVYDINEQEYLSSPERLRLLTKAMLFDSEDDISVPVLWRTFSLCNETIESLLSRADDTSVINRSVLREGLVFKNITIPSISFKVVSNTYLLKEK